MTARRGDDAMRDTGTRDQVPMELDRLGPDITTKFDQRSCCGSDLAESNVNTNQRWCDL